MDVAYTMSRPAHEAPAQKGARSGNAGWGWKTLVSFKLTAWPCSPACLREKIEHILLTSLLAWFEFVSLVFNLNI